MDATAVNGSPYFITSNRHSDKQIRVCFYGRVSTQHEAQVNALENQIQWYDTVLKDHHNWEKVDVYIDKGITGTQAKKRPGFMKMIEDAKQKKFDLICTREVSRFARNTVDSLSYTRMLKDMGVEVFFYNDNIWSMEADGELRLTLMSAMSQEESRHISERVLAGQLISRKKGILYGNGNILGYKLIRGAKSEDNTYEIEEEGAETVRLIYDLYLERIGVRGISFRLQELGRKMASGSQKWTPSTVLRILDNKTYAGYIGYNKSHTQNYLEHSRSFNRNREQYEYVKGNFPAIIPIEKWEKTQALKNSKLRYYADGTKHIAPQSADRWTRVLRCSCGASFKKYKWRTNKNGKVCYGFTCRTRVDYRSVEVRRSRGMEIEGFCDVPSICEWKLDFTLKSILKKLWTSPDETKAVLCQTVEENFIEERNATMDDELSRINRELQRLQVRKDNLLDMMLDGTIDKGTYTEKNTEIEARIEKVKSSIPETETIETVVKEDIDVTISNIKQFLDTVCDLEA